ncbi:MAG: hypothetical protein WCK63_08555 [Betaproteobacteria bacterium]
MKLTKQLAIHTALVIATLSISACGGSSGVIMMDKNTYYISMSNARVGMGPPSPATIAAVYSEANQYCEKENKEVKRINNIYTDSALGKTANFSLEFTCVPKS